MGARGEGGARGGVSRGDGQGEELTGCKGRGRGKRGVSMGARGEGGAWGGVSRGGKERS